MSFQPFGPCFHVNISASLAACLGGIDVSPSQCLAIALLATQTLKPPILRESCMRSSEPDQTSHVLPKTASTVLSVALCTITLCSIRPSTRQLLPGSQRSRACHVWHHSWSSCTMSLFQCSTLKSRNCEPSLHATHSLASKPRWPARNSLTQAVGVAIWMALYCCNGTLYLVMNCKSVNHCSLF